MLAHSRRLEPDLHQCVTGGWPCCAAMYGTVQTATGAMMNIEEWYFCDAESPLLQGSLAI
jgi:hypothetical protein